MNATRPPHPTPPRQRASTPDLPVTEGEGAWPGPDTGDAGPPEAATDDPEQPEPDYVPADEPSPDPEPAAGAPGDETEAEPPYFD